MFLFRATGKIATPDIHEEANGDRPMENQLIALSTDTKCILAVSRPRQ
jgi:hypothetical protein